MPSTHVVFYQEKEGDAPVVQWLKELRSINVKAFDKCRAALTRLALLGHELRRPEADYLGEGIYELRIRLGSINYRLLYFFHGRNQACLSHGLTKEAAVPPEDIDTAVSHKELVEADPERYTADFEL